MQINLEGQTAIVTGAAHRVGRAIALALATRGVNILVHYHRAEASQVRETVQTIKSLGVAAYSAHADLGRPEGVAELFRSLEERFNRLDIVVNSASVFQARDFQDLSLEDWDLTMAVNLRAPFLIIRRAAQLMSANPRPGGVIVNICDAGVDGPWLKYPHHGVSKSALWSLTQVSALALAPDIRVNAVLPGPVLKTDRPEVSDAYWARVADRIPLGRTGTPDDVGRAVVYLCQEDFITGALLHVNGGEHLP